MTKSTAKRHFKIMLKQNRRDFNKLNKEDRHFKVTCAYKTGAASVDEIVVVGQDEGTPLLHLQTVLTTGDSLTAVHLGGLEVLRTQPGLINHLGGTHREIRVRESDGEGAGRAY